ncbi:MAG TPA: adenylate/guanylate cyclase domain-containing protein [Chitinophagaceae bacterium]|jgi:class 3 adenylate cyclase/TolB-like protein/Tfp pilus assembly protein PilF|nr:adenylate/guanylate cyclase domain-containing protein [Chitinophagaceae bacterium]
MSQSRQLAAIMFTDIVGYTALMSNDEKKAIELLNKNRSLQKPIIERNNGRWIKEMGDGVMASFNTASDAVNAAMQIQEACNAANQFKIKIGIHLGEVVFENNDVYGDGVNVASRIETLGVGASILLSKTVRDQVKNNAEFQLSSLGTFEFKNVEEPLEVFAVSNPGFVVPKRENIHGKLKKTRSGSAKRITTYATTALVVAAVIFLWKYIFFKKTQATPRSIAILPFENPKKDSSLLYLSDGIPENLINRLSSFSDVKVFARSATFKLADSSKNISSLRKLLNADVVLTGQLQQDGGVYYLSCQLVDAADQNQVWGNKYQMRGDNISQIEDSIVTSLMNPLRITLLDNSKGIQQDKPVNPQAYAEYLKGRYLSYGSTPEESEKALAHFREAIRIDPKYAAAYAAIANEKIVQSLFSTASQKEIINEARTAIEAAEALDPNIPEIYTSEGALKFYYDWDWKGAVESYKKALQLDPHNATIYIRYSATLADVGRYEEALPLADKAVKLDPVSISSLHNLGWTNLVAGNFQKSADAFQKALDLHPAWVWGYIKQAYAYVYLKQYDKAISNAEKAEKLFQDGWGSELLQVALAFIYTKSNDKANADRVTDRFFKYAATNKVEDPWDLSYIYYLRGDYQRATEWEEKAVAERSPDAYLMGINIMYDKKYFEGAAHQQVLKKMGFVN